VSSFDSLLKCLVPKKKKIHQTSNLALGGTPAKAQGPCLQQVFLRERGAKFGIFFQETLTKENQIMTLLPRGYIAV